MKILVLSYEYPPLGGGGGVICKNISENLAKLDRTVTILTTDLPATSNQQPATSNQPCEIARSKRLGIISQGKQLATSNKQQATSNDSQSSIINLNIIRLKANRKNAHESNPIEMLSWISTTKKFISNNPDFMDFDICMAHFVLPGGEVARWLKRKYGLPYVLISHGHEIPWIHPRQMFLFHLAAYFWIKNVCKLSSANFIQTRMMKTNIDRFLGRKYQEKNIIIPNGVDTRSFYPDYSKRPDKLRIIFVGRLVIQKDPMTFLRAIKLFSDHTHDFEVHILGNGNLRKKMEGFVLKNGLEGNIRFLGKINYERMLIEYQSAHLMVAPSLNEGMSISSMEALSAGVYLIATRASGFEDMISENINGEFIAFKNPKLLSQKIKNFSDSFRTNQINRENQISCPTKIYDWQFIATKYQDKLIAFL